ncbi:hypothetical protein [Adhaeribacter aquaticus]|uniref:hypothetical protein n=1 Tax=Adhaeribacter aquaticus TaxID=299567 RepID=UPI0004127432|nr:hypothetical protein [Adhaeribacter aquaticus]
MFIRKHLKRITVIILLNASVGFVMHSCKTTGNSNGQNTILNESKNADSLAAEIPDAPEENRFTKTILPDDLNEPMELAVVVKEALCLVNWIQFKQ